MAIQNRRGLYVNLDISKLLPGEFSFSTDKKVIHACFAAGYVKQLATYEDMVDNINKAVDQVKIDFTAGLTDAIDNANQWVDNNTDAVNAKITEVNEIIEEANAAVLATNQSKTDADEAAERANTAAETAEGIIIGTNVILRTEKGQPDGVASLDSDGKVPESLLPLDAIFPDNIVLMGGAEEDIESEIPKDADLLGGHNAAYFEALVTAVSNRVTANLNSIILTNNNLGTFIKYKNINVSVSAMAPNATGYITYSIPSGYAPLSVKCNNSVWFLMSLSYEGYLFYKNVDSVSKTETAEFTIFFVKLSLLTSA
jgi:hypothetical protein